MVMVATYKLATFFFTPDSVETLPVCTSHSVNIDVCEGHAWIDIKLKMERVSFWIESIWLFKQRRQTPLLR